MAEINETPSGLRTHIAFFGRVNAGKSSLINALCGQDVSIVSPEQGTTTDPVYKPIEIQPIGPCLLIDTAGLADGTAIGEKRLEKTREVMKKADIAVIVFDGRSADVSGKELEAKSCENAGKREKKVIDKKETKISSDITLNNRKVIINTKEITD
ncbi:MAG: 50S ribosome-binding GTPase, partial [Eubacterium sp.]|nr:50S ribosome-binding GTPase [Eubacterium sp.]